MSGQGRIPKRDDKEGIDPRNVNDEWMQGRHRQRVIFKNRGKDWNDHMYVGVLKLKPNA